MALRKASIETEKVQLGSTEDYLEVKTAISKRDFNRLVAAMPESIDTEKGLTPIQGTEFQEALFEILVVGWSSPDAPSVDSYLSLDAADANELDGILVNHFTKITNVGASDEKKPAPSRKASVKDNQ